MRGAIGVSIAKWRRGADGTDGGDGVIDGADNVQDVHCEYYRMRTTRMM